MPNLLLRSWFLACWASCHFHWTGFSLHSASTARAFAELGFCCAWPLPGVGQTEVVSARLNLSHGTRYFGEMCNFFGSVSLQQKFEAMDQCYSSVLFGKQGKYNLRHEGGWTQKKRPQSILLPSFYMFISSPPPPTPNLSLPCANWAGQGAGMFVSPEVLTLVLGPSFVLFLQASLSLSFSHHHFGLLFPILTT